MVRCPSCGSYRVFVIVAPERRARCIQCGSKWARVSATVNDEPPQAIHDEDLSADPGTEGSPSGTAPGASEPTGEVPTAI